MSGHTDGVGEARDNRSRSFRRGQAVQQYLSSALGNQYHWVVIGYGESPLNANDTNVNRQGNRRIELAIEQ